MTILLACLLLGALAVPAGAAPGGNAEAAKRCRSDWATLRGTGGETFRNQGACVSHAARGGTFAELTVTAVFNPPAEPGSVGVTLSVTGAPAGSEVHWTVLAPPVVVSAQGVDFTTLFLGLGCPTDGLITVSVTVLPSGAQSGVLTFPVPPEDCPAGT